MIIEYCILCLCISTELGYNGAWTDKHELGDINCWGLGSLCASRPKMATSRLRCRRNTSPRTWCAGSMSHVGLFNAILGLIQSYSIHKFESSGCIQIKHHIDFETWHRYRLRLLILQTCGYVLRNDHVCGFICGMPCFSSTHIYCFRSSTLADTKPWQSPWQRLKHRTAILPALAKTWKRCQ